MALTEAKIKANKKYDAKAYDTLGAKTRKGIKDIIGIIAKKNNLTVSDFIKTAVQEYAKTLEGKDILNDSINDLDMIIKIVQRPKLTNERNQPFVYEKDIEKLFELRNRAEKNYQGQVISENDFKNKFEKSKGIVNKLASKIIHDVWYWADNDIFDVLYLLVYQANKK